MKPSRKSILGPAFLAAALAAQANDPIYDNLLNPLNAHLGNLGPYGETADDIHLARTGLFVGAKIAYHAAGFDGNEFLTLNLYDMNGAPTPGSFGFHTPGTLLYTQTVPADGSGIAFIVDNTPNVILPDYIAVGLVFTGVKFDANTSDAGPAFFDTPTPGPVGSYDDFWLKGYRGDPNWALYDFDGKPAANFGVQILVVPEANTAIAMAGLGAAAAGMTWRHLRRARPAP